MSDSPTNIQQKNWDAVASEWSTHFEWYAAAFQPFIDWCCNAIATAPGYRVLDLASGTGMPALQLAARVVPGGTIVAADISPEMLRVLAHRVQQLKVCNIELHQMDASALRFPDASFDAVTCAFGLMFCPNPARVLSEIRRVLKPGGRFAISTWAPPAENSFITAYGRAVADVLSLPRYDRLAPGPFRFTQCDEIESLLDDAGFTNVSVAKRAQSVVYASVDAYQATSQALTPGLTDRLRALSANEVNRLRTSVRSNAQPFFQGDTVCMLATPICASGQTPT